MGFFDTGRVAAVAHALEIPPIDADVPAGLVTATFAAG